MNIKLIITSVLAFSMILFSCKRKTPDNVIDDPKDQGVEKYMPTKTGTWWLYNSTDGNQYKRSATSKDSSVDGISFKYFKYTNLTTSDDNPEYFGLFDGKLYMIFYFSADGTNPYKAIILKDSAKVGDTWLNSGKINYSLGEVDMEITGTVESINDVYATPTTTFDSVIRVKNKLRAKTSIIPWTDCGTITMWFAPGVGIVKHDNDINVSVFYTKKNTDSLVDYFIAP